jgi:hypothetical protein
MMSTLKAEASLNIPGGNIKMSAAQSNFCQWCVDHALPVEPPSVILYSFYDKLNREELIYVRSVYDRWQGNRLACEDMLAGLE